MSWIIAFCKEIQVEWTLICMVLMSLPLARVIWLVVIWPLSGSSVMNVIVNNWTGGDRI